MRSLFSYNKDYYGGALMVLIRSRNSKAATAQWLDGGVVALAVGAVLAQIEHIKVFTGADYVRIGNGPLIETAAWS